jgi:hypothetical protein
MGASATLVGGAAAAFGGLTRALGYVAAGGAAAIGLGGPVVIYLASVAEAHGGTLAADYPQIVEAGKVLVGATTGAALGKFVLMAAGDRSLRFADTLLRRPGPDEMTGPGEIAHGLRTIGRGLRTGAEAVAGALSGIGGAAEPNFGRG